MCAVDICVWCMLRDTHTLHAQPSPVIIPMQLLQWLTKCDIDSQRYPPHITIPNNSTYFSRQTVHYFSQNLQVLLKQKSSTGRLHFNLPLKTQFQCKQILEFLTNIPHPPIIHILRKCQNFKCLKIGDKNARHSWERNGGRIDIKGLSRENETWKWRGRKVIFTCGECQRVPCVEVEVTGRPVRVGNTLHSVRHSICLHGTPHSRHIYTTPSRAREMLI